MEGERREPDFVIEHPERFATDKDAIAHRPHRHVRSRHFPSRLTPEPEDIDRRSREHDKGWREHLRDRIEDDDASSLQGEVVRLPEPVRARRLVN